MSGTSYIPEVAAILTAVGFGGVIVKFLNRGVDAATAEKMHAETRKAVQETASNEVDTIRSVLAEVRIAELQKTNEISELKSDMHTLRDRLDKLEERERHSLTRAAVHEAWDQMAFAALLALNPRHPPPPPLTEGVPNYSEMPDFRFPPDDEGQPG